MPYKNYLPLLFIIVAFLIFFGDLNVDLFLKINNVGNLFPDIFWAFLTTFGNKTFALVFVFLLFWKRSELLLSVLIASVLAGVISGILKPLFDLSRPTDILLISDYFLIGPKISGHSFPSGHTLSAFAIASAIIFYYKKYFLSVSLLILASLVGLSRIMLGVHWPIDVLIGAALGFSCGYAGVQFLEFITLMKRQVVLLGVYIVYFLLAIRLLLKGTTYSLDQFPVMLIAVAGVLLSLFLLIAFLKNKL